MIHADFFSGIGMWALAAREMGWKTVSFCEKDKFCHRVLQKNFGKRIPIFPDVFTTNYAAIKSFYRKFGYTGADRRIDILTLSTPCQPFSQAGEQKGSADERHLFPEGVRLISEIRPRWVVIENVRGLLSIESGRTFEEYHTRLESEGYSVQSFCIPASAFNAPHRRDRLWIVANREGNGIQRPTRQNRQPFGSRFEEGGLDFERNNQITTNSIGVRELQQERFEQNIRRWVGDKDCRIAANAESSVRELSGDSRTRRAGFTNSDFNAAVAFSQRFQGNEFGRTFVEGAGASRSVTEFFENEHWLEASIRLCGMDDGLPEWLDASERRTIYNAVGYVGGEEVSQKVGFDCRAVENFLHRTNRLKALGNSIVWLIAYEIFKAIEYADTYTN